MMSLLSEPLVLAAMIAAVPASIAAVASVLNRKDIKTGNGATIGQVAAQMMTHIQDECRHTDCEDETHHNRSHLEIPPPVSWWRFFTT